jgi:hypothetical protein
MKVLQKVILGLGLIVGSMYAQDVSNTIHSPGYIKDYTVIIKPATELKQGYNDININFTHKSHVHNDLNTKLTIYSPNKSSKEYKGINTKKNGEYVFNINLPEKGSYRYILTFSHNVGVTQIKRGSFDLN